MFHPIIWKGFCRNLATNSMDGSWGFESWWHRWWPHEGVRQYKQPFIIDKPYGNMGSLPCSPLKKSITPGSIPDNLDLSFGKVSTLPTREYPTTQANWLPPVFAPSATPAVDSAKVATVETPNIEPMRAAIASARYASFRCPIRAYRLWDEPLHRIQKKNSTYTLCWLKLRIVLSPHI